MDLQILMEYLQSGIEGDTLKLKSGKEIEFALTGLMQQMGSTSLSIEHAVLRLLEEEILLEGECRMPVLAGRDKARICFSFQIRDGQVWYSLSLIYRGSYSLDSFFGGIHPFYYTEDGRIRSEKDALTAVQLIAPAVSTDSSRMRDRDPFTIKSAVVVRPEGRWKRYSTWLSGLAEANGYLSMKKAGFMGNYVDFWFELPVAGGSFSNGLFLGTMLSGSLAILIDSHATVYDDVTRRSRRMTRIEARCGVSLKGIRTPVMVSAPLFGNEEDWHFETDFPDGLAVTDLAGFIMALLGMKQSQDILLPEDSPLDNFRLQSLHFGFWGNTAVPRQIQILASTKKPWKLPLPSLTFRSFDVEWNLLQGSQMPEWAGSYAMSATVSGALEVDLGKRSLELEATAYLPDMDIEAGLVWKEKEEKAALSDLFGVEAVEKLSEGQNKNLAEFYVYASANNRSLELSGKVRDILQWKIGNIDMKLAEVAAYAGYFQGSAVLFLQGIFGIGTGSEAFSFILEGGYSGDSWQFKGYLGSGVVCIGALLKGLLGISYQAEKAGFVLNQFLVAFDTKDHAFELEAGFCDTWEIPVGNLEIISRGTLKIKSSDQMTHPYLAAKLSLMLDTFRVSAEVVDFFDEEKVSYIFQVWLADHGVQAVYSKRAVAQKEPAKEDTDCHEFLTVELLNVSLGDLVLMMIQMINPNFHYTLPSPWNLLYKIDLSRFWLEYDITDGSITVSYRTDLKIPGLLEVHSVGLHYGMHGDQTEKTLRLVVMGKTLFDKESKDYGWDALNGQPPDVGSENDNRFHLHYLGVGQHFATEDMYKAESIDQAMQCMEETFEEAAFDLSTGFILGVHFSLENMLDFQLVFQDPVLYGISVTVSASKQPLAYLRGLSLMLMYKKITKDIGMFRARLMIPDRMRHIRLGIMNLTLGEIGVDIYTNGDFALDLGFPEKYDFSRSFALEAGGYCGHGGLKFGKLGNETAVDIPKTDKGVFHPVISIGVGLSLGLGRSFDFGVVKGGVSLEVTGILEGVFAVFHPDHGNEDDLYYSVSAAVGIKGRLYLEADLKIITISASVEIEAWAALAMVAYEPVVISLLLEMTLKAKIKILFIKISFSFHFKAEVTFRLGEDNSSSAPWALRARRAKRCLVVQKLFGSGVVSEEKVRIPLHIEQMYSLDGGKWCAAFVPLIYKNEFRKLVGVFVNRLFGSWSGDVTREEAAELSFEVIKEKADYQALSEVLNGAVVMELEEPKRYEGNFEEEAVVFPMPPALTLSLCRLAVPSDEEEESYKVNYWEYQMVDQEYADLIRQYFDSISPVKDQKEERRSGLQTQRPLAEVIFTDYFQMVLRSVVDQLHSLYELCEADISDLTQAEECCGLTLSEILFVNQQLEMKAGEFLVNGCVILLEEGETLDSLACKCGRTFQEVLEEIVEVPQILNQRAYAEFPSFEINQKQFGWSAELAAAFFFVRLYGEEIKEGYQKTAEKILEDNSEIITGLEWEEHRGGSLVELPEIKDWYTVAGDTVTRLAKYCTVLGLQEGENSRWDEFLKAVRLSAEHDCVTIPAGRISLSGELTLGSLLRRLYPYSWNPETAPVFRTMSSVILTKRVVVSEGSTLSEVIQKNKLTVKQAADCFVSTINPFRENQKFRLEKIPYLRKEWIDRMLKREDWIDETGAMASRFMLQGLRLPIMNEEHKVTGLSAFYKLLGQQILLEEEYGTLLNVKPASAKEYPDVAVSWLTGELRKETAWSEILPQLPMKEYRCSIKKEDISILPDKKMVVRTYGAVQTMQLMDKGGVPSSICFVGDDMQAAVPFMENIVMMTGKDQSDALVLAAAAIEFKVKRTEMAGYFLVEGVGAADRDRLKTLYMVMKRETEISYALCHCPSPLQSKGILYQGEWSKEDSIFMRANLSLETQAPANGVRHSSEVDVVRLGSAEFQRLLWECSIVGGAGYYLNLVTKNGETLPEDSFDEAGMCSVWILAQDISGRELMESGCCNAVAVWEDISGLNAEGQRTVSFYASGNADPSLLYAQRQFPAGCIGAELKMEAPAEDAEDVLSRTKRLFQIVGYDVVGADFMDSALDSAPLVPQEGGGNIWKYVSVIPLYRYVAEGNRDFIYASLGKEGRILYSFRDILGNVLDGYYESPDFRACYNDPVIGLKQCPGILYEYDFCTENGKAYLDIILRAGERERLQYPEEAAKRLRQCVLQMSMEDVSVTAGTSIAGEYVWEREKKDRLVGFVDEIAGYLEGAAINQPEQHFLFAIEEGQQQEQRCYPLSVSVTVSRGQYLPEGDEECVRSETRLAPAVKAKYEDRTQSDSGESRGEEQPEACDGAVEFARKFEAIFPRMKLARSTGIANADFYVVTVGEGGLIPSFEIRPRTWIVDETTVKAPTYFGLMPLSNRQISRECSVDQFADGVWQENPVQQIFAHVDLDAWAMEFLNDFEFLLNGEYGKRAAVLNASIVQRWLNVKKMLAQVIGGQMELIGEYAADGFCSSELVADRARRSLSEAFDVACAAEYDLIWNEAASQRFRLLANVIRSDSEQEEWIQVKPGKIDSESNVFCLLYHSDQAQRSGFSMNFSISITELEWKIETEAGGYEKSEWLTFLLPLTQEYSGVDIDLRSDFLVPNPLRRIPLNPELKKQEPFMQSEILYLWDYRLYWRAMLAEQDTYRFHVAFRKKSKSVRVQEKDLFDYLAQYQYARKMIWDCLKGADQEIFLNTAEAFADLSENIQQAWEVWTGQKRRGLQNCYSKDSADLCTVSVQAGFESGPHLMVTSDWENVGVEFENGQNKVQAGEYADMRLQISGLNLYQYNLAVPISYTVRNENLLKLRSGETVPVNPGFVYTSEKIEMDELYAGQTVREENVLFTVTEPDITSAVKFAAQKLFACLGLEGVEEVSVGIVLHYCYKLGGNEVELPASMLLPERCGPDSAHRLSAAFLAWHEKYLPAHRKFSLRLQIIIRPDKKEEILLGLENLRIDFEI